MKTMKTFFLVAICSVVCISASAQLPIGLGVKGGATFSDISKFNDDFKYGFNFGVAVDYEVANSVYLMSGLHLITKGAKGNELGGVSIAPGTATGKGKMDVNPIYLQVPIHAGYKFQVAPATKFVLRAGPYVAYGIGGKAKGEGDFKGVDQDFFTDGTKKFEMGIGGAAGAELGKFTADLAVDLALTKVWENRSSKNRVAYISIGYKLW